MPSSLLLRLPGAALLCLVAAAPSAQQPAQPVLPVVAPAGEPPPLRFVALVNEPGPDATAADPDWVATAWEVPVAAPPVRRVVFGRSPWSAAPLLDAPTLLRWQVPAPERRPRYSVRLLRVDYATFAARELLRAGQATAIGASGDRVYLDTSDGPRLLDVATGEVAPLAIGFELLARRGDDWLVVADGRPQRFDARAGELTRRYDALRAPGGRRRGATDWRDPRFALRRGEFVDADGQPLGALPFGRWQVVFRELAVWDLDDGVESRVLARTLACGGSGEPVIAMVMHTELVGGLLRYSELRPGVDCADPSEVDWATQVEWVTIDVATGEEVLRAPYAPRDVPQVDVMEAHRVPPYLRGRLAELMPGPFDLEALARAFFAHAEVDVPGDRSNLDAVCRTPDGGQLLVKQGATFYLCDLETQAVTTWAAPGELQRAPLQLFAVPLR